MSGPSAHLDLTSLRVADFDYDLPAELIAQQPLAERGTSRMLVMDRATGAFRDDFFSRLGENLRRGDLLVLNDSRVIPARLFARRTLVRERERPTGQIEVMLTAPAGENLWRALVRPGRKVAIGERLIFPSPDGGTALEAEVIERGSRRFPIFLPCSIASGTSRCRPIFTAMTRTSTASATRPSSHASAVPWLLQLRVCTLRRQFSMPCASAALRLHTSRSTWAWEPLRRYVSIASTTSACTASTTLSASKPPKR
jgi:hypothetical protein